MPARTSRVAVAPEYNHLDNAGFELNQRGLGSYTANVTLDRWTVGVAGSSTATVSQITSTVGSAGKSLQLAYTHVAAGAAEVIQKAEHFTQLQGRVVTFAVTLKSTVNATVFLYVYDGTTTISSAFNSGTGSQRLVVSATLGASATVCQVGIKCSVASCTVEANDATLVVGGVPADYAPLHPQMDMARCERYYEVHGGAASAILVQSYGAAGVNAGNYLSYHTKKMATPTVTKNGTWAVSNCGQPTTGFANADGYTLVAIVTALGAFNFSCNSTDDTITSEINP